MRVQFHSINIKACLFLCFAAVLVGSIRASAVVPVSDLLMNPSPTDDLPATAGVIVQGVPQVDLVAAVENLGGEVTRDLAVIDAVAARVPENQLDALRRAPGVRRVWEDGIVQAEQAGDSDGTSAPVEGDEVPEARFLLNRVVTTDGKREPVDNLGKGGIDPAKYVFFTFTPAVDPLSAPGGVYLHLSFFEEGAGQGPGTGASALVRRLACL